MSFIDFALGGFVAGFVYVATRDLCSYVIRQARIFRARRALKAAARKAAAEPQPIIRAESEPLVGRVVAIGSDGSVSVRVGQGPSPVFAGFRIVTSMGEALEDCDCPICKSAREQEAARKARMS